MKLLKKIGIVLAHLVVVAGLFVAFGFIRQERDGAVVKDLDLRVDHKGGSYFIDREGVLAQLRRAGFGKLEGMRLDSLNLLAIEKAIAKNPYVATSEAYIDMQGHLSIRVTQRQPVLRIINRYMESFYVDAEGRTMPASPNYAAPVMVASGNIGDRPAPGDTLRSEAAKQVFVLNEYLRNNELYNALFVQVYVNAQGELELVPRVGNHTVLVGEPTEMDEKMEKLLALYRTALDKEGWEQYRQINVKFKDQVICKR